MLMLLLVLIEIPLLLLLVLITGFARAIKETTSIKTASSVRSKKPCELTDEEQEKIVNAILEDALLENDSAWDTLIFGGEANYPAADAAKLDIREFDLQYGTKSWIKAWTKGLSRFFDCQTEYVGSGTFRIYGKEA